MWGLLDMQSTGQTLNVADRQTDQLHFLPLPSSTSCCRHPPTLFTLQWYTHYTPHSPSITPFISQFNLSPPFYLPPPWFVFSLSLLPGIANFFNISNFSYFKYPTLVNWNLFSIKILLLILVLLILNFLFKIVSTSR